MQDTSDLDLTTSEIEAVRRDNIPDTDDDLLGALYTQANEDQVDNPNWSWSAVTQASGTTNPRIHIDYPDAVVALVAAQHEPIG